MEEVVKLFSDHGTLVQPDALDYIMSKDDPIAFASHILSKMREYPLVLSLEDIKALEEIPEKKEEKPSTANFQEEEEVEEREEEEEKYELPLSSPKGWKPLAKEYDAEIEILKDVTGKSTCRGNIEDFSLLFKHRYESIKKIFLSRRNFSNSIPFSKIKKGYVKEVQLIGLVREVRESSRGHKIVEIEDEEGVVTLLIPSNDHHLIQQANELVTDEVISVTGKVSRNGDLIIVQSISYPDISVNHKKNSADVPLYVAFLADPHIGSKMFLWEKWKLLVKWLNGNAGNSRQREVAGRIKYVVIPGDTVDGIGIYPNQEKELSIKDIYKQYETLSELLNMFPDHITIIIQPGNHDAVRPAEPQPAFEEELREIFSGRDIVFVGNPCYFSLHGVEVLSYHGQSLLDYATNIPTLRYNEPIEIMKVALKKRHLAPIYGGHTPIAPEHVDYMVIDRVPDIFVTGHVHLTAIGEYRGVTLINASSWQAQTSYQKMLNFVPDPAKLPIVDLKTGKATTMDFTRGI